MTASHPCQELEERGFLVVPSGISGKILADLREEIFPNNRPGKRCLLDHPLVRQTAGILHNHLSRIGLLAPQAVAIQAIAFDKTPETNWKVAWHQDLIFPFARPVSAPGFSRPTLKDGVPHAKPPENILRELLAVRLHLDDCGASNGPLRVSPGTHLSGIIPTADIPARASRHGEVSCLAKTGELLLMHPLTLHASSQAAAPRHRRIVHFVYHSGSPVAEPWHRAVGSSAFPNQTSHHS